MRCSRISSCSFFDCIINFDNQDFIYSDSIDMDVLFGRYGHQTVDPKKLMHFQSFCVL